jgi:hypothetical protein
MRCVSKKGKAMNQMYLRKVHKAIGIILVLFIFLQAGSGLFLSFSVSHSHAHTDAVIIPDKHDKDPNLLVKEKAVKPEKYEAVTREVKSTVHNHGDEADDHQGMLQLVHHGGGFIGSIYRVLLASGFLFMAFSGSSIFYLTRKAMRH